MISFLTYDASLTQDAKRRCLCLTCDNPNAECSLRRFDGLTIGDIMKLEAGIDELMEEYTAKHLSVVLEAIRDGKWDLDRHLVRLGANSNSDLTNSGYVGISRGNSSRDISSSQSSGRFYAGILTRVFGMDVLFFIATHQSGAIRGGATRS